jgi:hypothetical protein
LLNTEDRAALLARLDALGPDATRQWGRMSVGGMLCHLTDAFAMVQPEAAAGFSPRLHERTLMRWIALSTPVPWPRGVPTAPACDQEKDGTPPAEFDHDRDRLHEAIDRFLRDVDGGRLFHPLFGSMSRGEWGRWGYRHTDHHLRQFGV